MSTDRTPEDELRALLQGSIPAPSSLDPDRIVSAAKRRRRPRQIGAGIVGALAIVGIVSVGVQTLPLGGVTSVSMVDGAAPGSESLEYSSVTDEPVAISSDGGGSSDGAGDAVTAAPVCGATLFPSVASAGALSATAGFPSVLTLDTLGVVTVSNAGDTAVTGTASVTVVASQAGTVVGVSAGEPAVVTVPAGGTTDLAASVDALGCTPLTLPTGNYDISTQIELTLGTTTVVLSTAPSAVELR